jgi:germination protein M
MDEHKAKTLEHETAWASMGLSGRQGRRLALRFACAVVAIAGLVTACGGSAGTVGPPPTPSVAGAASASPAGGTPAATPASVSPASPGPPSASPSTTAVRVYLFESDQAGGDPHLVPVNRTVSATEPVAAAAIRELLAGPAADERGLVTMIPAGTRLLGVVLGGSTATVDLTGTFESGGGSMSMLGRLAQLVYTATQFKGVDTVRLRLDGQLVESIGGEGVMIGSGLGRKDLTSSLPPIFVDQPAWGGELPSPGRVTGLANVFEAQFGLQVLDGQHRVLADVPVRASCGTGCWGTFDATVQYSVAAPAWGILRVFDLSAKDGTPIDVREYPVRLTPAG